MELNITNTLTREYFMNRTGVFITHTHFVNILGNFEESDLSPARFCRQWKEENNWNICDIEQFKTLHVDFFDDDLFRFESDEMDDNDKNFDSCTVRLLESLSESVNYWRDKYTWLADQVINLYPQFKEFKNFVNNEVDEIMSLNLNQLGDSILEKISSDEYRNTLVAKIIDMLEAS